MAWVIFCRSPRRHGEDMEHHNLQANEAIIQNLQTHIRGLSEMVMEAANREANLRGKLIMAHQQITDLERQLIERKETIQKDTD